jgi:hypothetical protein
VGPIADLDDVEKRTFFVLLGLELRPSVVQPVTSLNTDCAIPALYAVSKGQNIIKFFFWTRFLYASNTYVREHWKCSVSRLYDLRSRFSGWPFQQKRTVYSTEDIRFLT